MIIEYPKKLFRSTPYQQPTIHTPPYLLFLWERAPAAIGGQAIGAGTHLLQHQQPTTISVLEFPETGNPNPEPRNRFCLTLKT